MRPPKAAYRRMRAQIRMADEGYGTLEICVPTLIYLSLAKLVHRALQLCLILYRTTDPLIMDAISPHRSADVTFCSKTSTKPGRLFGIKRRGHETIGQGCAAASKTEPRTHATRRPWGNLCLKHRRLCGQQYTAPDAVCSGGGTCIFGCAPKRPSCGVSLLCPKPQECCGRRAKSQIRAYCTAPPPVHTVYNL